MDADYFRMLFNYNHWANSRVLDRAAELTDDQFAQDAGLSMGSIRGTLAHQLGTEVIWLARSRGDSTRTILADRDFSDYASMRERWQLQDANQAAFMSRLTDDDVNNTVTYTTIAGQEYRQLLGHMLARVVNHGMQFRSEAAVALTRLGHSPGDIDLIVYLRQLGS